MKFKNKVAIVTGSGRGIGAATAELLASEGAVVYLVSRTLAELQNVQAAIARLWPEAKTFCVAMDVSDEGAVSRLFQRVQAEQGRLDILVNNAATLVSRNLIDTTVEEWDRTFAINVRGMFLFCRQLFRGVRDWGWKSPSVVNISSLAGIRAVDKFPGLGAYTASKHAVVGLTEAFAAESKTLGVRVNCIAPGAVATKMLQDAAPGYQTKTVPMDIARLIVHFCDSKESGVLSGTVLEVHSNEP
jgi:NAD(P)-dependent dehydrogenase (short-subunit alcohol dehydrogenase family)